MTRPGRRGDRPGRGGQRADGGLGRLFRGLRARLLGCRVARALQLQQPDLGLAQLLVEALLLCGHVVELALRLGQPPLDPVLRLGGGLGGRVAAGEGLAGSPVGAGVLHLDVLEPPERLDAVLAEQVEGGGTLQHLPRTARVEEDTEGVERVLAHVGLAAHRGDVVRQLGHRVPGGLELVGGCGRLLLGAGELHAGAQHRVGGGLRLDGHALEGFLGAVDTALDGLDAGGHLVPLGSG